RGARSGVAPAVPPRRRGEVCDGPRRAVWVTPHAGFPLREPGAVGVRLVVGCLAGGTVRAMNTDPSSARLARAIGLLVMVSAFAALRLADVEAYPVLGPDEGIWSLDARDAAFFH